MTTEAKAPADLSEVRRAIRRAVAPVVRVVENCGGPDDVDDAMVDVVATVARKASGQLRRLFDEYSGDAEHGELYDAKGLVDGIAVLVWCCSAEGRRIQGATASIPEAWEALEAFGAFEHILRTRWVKEVDDA